MLAAVRGCPPSECLYFSHVVGGQFEKFSPGLGRVSPAHMTSAHKLMGVCPTDCLNGGLSPESKML